MLNNILSVLRHIMKNELELLKVLRVASECNTFREAAIKLGASPQAVTRAIKSLEKHYNEVLFHRSTRQVKITEFGSKLVERLCPVLDEFNDLWKNAKDEKTDLISGRVKITAPISLGPLVVLPSVVSIMKANPSLSVDLRLTDRIINTVDEGVDVGVRVGFLHDSGYIARKASVMRLVIVGSPSLIEAVGKPQSISELTNYPIIASLDTNTGRAWPWNFKDARQWTPKFPVFTTDNADIELAAALDGIGFSQQADYMVADYIRKGDLVQVLESEEPSPWGLYVYRSQPNPVPRRVRIIFDELHRALSQLDRLDYKN